MTSKRATASPPRVLFVTGGVISSLGKGIAVAALGRLFVARGLSVMAMKCDPYINVDPGTMNPFQHGEVFVTDDGAETDLDLGHYERFIGENATRIQNITAGQIYDAVIRRERRGEYLGETVQVIPHVVDEIKARIRYAACARRIDVLLVEIGGTVGDIESLPFLEAIRELRADLGRTDDGHPCAAYLHVTLVPHPATAGEPKTKPTQHSVAALREIGIFPDFIVARSEKPLTERAREKIALFANLPSEAVLSLPDLDTIYAAPLVLAEAGADRLLLERWGLASPGGAGGAGGEDLAAWRGFVERLRADVPRRRIAIVGKYTALTDAYKSVTEALLHAGAACGVRVEPVWVDSDRVSEADCAALEGIDGMIVPGGFGVRGVEGMIAAVRIARERKIPFLGICLGMQCAVVEFARNVAGLAGANSTEFDPRTPHPVVDLLPGAPGEVGTGGTMRLGGEAIHLVRGSRAAALYEGAVVRERHRHRYEVSAQYRARLEEAGLRVSGKTEGGLVEIIELPDHPYFVASQFHPEFTSRPLAPNPLFVGLVGKNRDGD